MSQEDYKFQIDRWLKSIGGVAQKKLWIVTSSLDLEWQLRDTNDFYIPLSRLLSNPLVNKEDLVAILTSLENKKILLVIRYLGEWEESEDPEAPYGLKATTIAYTPNLIEESDTKIRISTTGGFRYLKDKLNELSKKKDLKFLSKNEIHNEIKNIIELQKLGKKEAKFLTLLSDLAPRKISWLRQEIPTKDCKHLKARVQEKIEGTNWFISTEAARGFQKDSFYQLEYLPLKNL